jgi:EAL domain-containing protein (putative c-di-GMP-specific phosphodiesterase class I)
VAGSGSAGALGRLLAEGGLRSAYQPIVDLDGREVVAVEALLRGPAGSPLERPGALFAAAQAEGRSEDLQRAAARCALEGSAGALPEGLTLFVNLDAGALVRMAEDPGDPVLALAKGRRVVVEVTEHDLLRNPSSLLRAAEVLRARGWGLAIDDVGLQHAEGVAAMALVRPDVVKLDMALVHGLPTRAEAAVGLAVQAFVEEHGGAVVAEGLETREHLDRAVVLGATLGQGWMHGRPGPLPLDLAAPTAPIALSGRPRGTLDATPWRIAEGRLRFRTATKRTLLPISHQLEARAIEAGPAVMLLGVFQDERHFTGRSAARYARLADRLAVVAALAAGLGPRPAGRVRGGDLAADDPLRDEWTVVVLGPHHAAALVARDLGGDSSADMDRPFAFAVTHDRPLVADLATCLVQRIGDRAALAPG